MPTDSNGNYSLPPVYKATTGELITVGQHNAPLEDISEAISGRLARNGSSPMSGPLMGVSGAVATPSFTFAADKDTGFYSSAPNVIGVVAGGEKIADFGKSGITFLSALNPSAGISLPAGCVDSTILKDGSVTFAELATSLIATQVQALAGTSTDTLMTPERVAQTVGAAQKIRQIVYGIATTSQNVSPQATWIDTGCAASITLGAGSKVLVLAVTSWEFTGTVNNSLADIYARLSRGATPVQDQHVRHSLYPSTYASDGGTHVMAHVDTGLSAGAYTYKTSLQAQTLIGGALNAQHASRPSALVLVEFI